MDQEMVDADTKQEGSSEESEALTNPLSKCFKAWGDELLSRWGWKPYTPSLTWGGNLMPQV